MNIQVVNGKVVFMKMFNDNELETARCLGFDVSEDYQKIIAKIDTTSREAMKEFLLMCDEGLMKSPAQRVKNKALMSQIKEAYVASYNKFMSEFKPDQLYSSVGRKLYKHQIETLWEYQKKKVNLCSFEQGLGKTIFAASISKLFKINRTIVVGPSLVKWNWFKDLSEDWGYNGMFFSVLDAKKSMEAMMHERFVITNYEMINKFWKTLTSKDCGHIIIDECHYAKNHGSGRSKSVQKLIKRYPNARVTLLTGTPVTNRVTDLFAYLKIAQHPLGSNFTKFKAKYALGTRKIVGVQNPEDLRAKISNFIVRKKTQECIDLPELRIS
ncbi:hypothetical protein DRO61_10170, partial [Candidatus Bathyarchaeota archaeon]